METSFQANGSILGTDVKETGTYWTVVRPDGTHYGEGQGVMILKDGKMATWTGHGVGTMKKDGTASYRGAVYYQTSPPRWARLNKVAVVFEYEVDAEGNTRSEFWNGNRSPSITPVFSRSHDALIRVYEQADNVIERMSRRAIQRERENFNHAVFTLAFFSRQQGRELPGAISRGLLGCPCRV